MDEAVTSVSRSFASEDLAVKMSSLTFEPYYCPRAWGGRRLQELFGKFLPPDGTAIGESWELSGHPQHVSQVADGVWQGTPLNDLWRRHGHRWTSFQESSAADRFPILVKLLDCHEPLSVQVHPDTAQAQRLKIDTTGKTEAWIVLHVDPGSELYAGWQPGVGPNEVQQHLAEGTLPQILHRITPQVGDAFIIPAGTVHAIGGGLLLLEIQQCSDATLRLFDWNRPQDPKRPRPLHIADALKCIDWSLGPIHRQIPELRETLASGVEATRLISTPFFVVDRIENRSRCWRERADELAIWVQISGRQVVRDYTTFPREMSPGQLMLALPHSGSWEWRRVDAQPSCHLKITLPAA